MFKLNSYDKILIIQGHRNKFSPNNKSNFNNAINCFCEIIKLEENPIELNCFKKNTVC